MLFGCIISMRIIYVIIYISIILFVPKGQIVFQHRKIKHKRCFVFMCIINVTKGTPSLFLLPDQCLLELQNEAVFMWTTELENMATLCFKALEGSNYGVRVAVAKLLGTVMATALMPKQAAGKLNS